MRKLILTNNCPSFIAKLRPILRSLALLVVLLQTFIGGALFCLAQGSDTSLLTGQLDSGHHPQRILNFPAKYSLGTLTIEEPDQNHALMRTEVLDAKGRVIVPAGCRVTLSAEGGLFKDPSVIKTLPPDGLDVLKTAKFSAAFMDESSWDKVLSFIGHLQGLEALYLTDLDVTDADIAHAGEVKGLQLLAIQHTEFKGAALKQLAALKNLKNLRLSENKIEVENLHYLSSFSALQSLTIAHCALTSAAMKYLGQCTSLTYLDLSSNQDIDDQSLKYLRGLKKLKQLRVHDTGVDVRGLLQLKGLPLKNIEVTKSMYKKDDIDNLQKAFPGVVLSMSGKRELDQDNKVLLAPLH
jgi:hypothetical protein